VTAGPDLLPPFHDAATTAVLAVDLHAGYLDPSLSGRAVLDPAEIGPLITANRRLFDLASRHGSPVIHAVLAPENLRGQRDPRLRNPRYRDRPETSAGKAPLIRAELLAARRGGGDIHPDLAPAPGDLVIDSKSSMSSFYGTELDRMIRVLNIDTVLITGINTNTCIQCAAFDCFNRFLRAVVVSDCVATGYGRDLHEAALENIRRCLGWVAPVADVDAWYAGALAPSAV
jgi:nicotinamidase-related amidase